MSVAGCRKGSGSGGLRDPGGRGCQLRLLSLCLALGGSEVPGGSLADGEEQTRSWERESTDFLLWVLIPLLTASRPFCSWTMVCRRPNGTGYKVPATALGPSLPASFPSRTGSRGQEFPVFPIALCHSEEDTLHACGCILNDELSCGC